MDSFVFVAARHVTKNQQKLHSVKEKGRINEFRALQCNALTHSRYEILNPVPFGGSQVRPNNPFFSKLSAAPNQEKRSLFHKGRVHENSDGNSKMESSRCSQVSNLYLSQGGAGKVKKPSPENQQVQHDVDASMPP
jgi:hypothetical protein